MRNKSKVEKVLSGLSHEDQRFATLFGAKALANRAMFHLANKVHYQIKNNSKAGAGDDLASLFAEAIERRDFRNVRKFVELLEEWTAESVQLVDDAPGLGFSLPFAKDPVGMALLMRAEIPIRLREKRPEDELSDEVPAVKIVRLEMLGCTARQMLDWLKIKAPGFKCDVKTIRNRAKELGIKLLPDSRGMRKGQKRKHVHRAPR